MNHETYVMDATCAGWLALFPGTQQKSERSTWYPLFMHISPLPKNFWREQWPGYILMNANFDKK